MNIVLKIILGVIFIFVAGFGIGTSISVPDNAIVYIDEKTETYLSPPCIVKGKSQFMPQMTISDVRDLTLSINKECVNQSGFVQDGRTLGGQFLESVGVLSIQESRWNSDGTWNW